MTLDYVLKCLFWSVLTTWVFWRMCRPAHDPRKGKPQRGTDEPPYPSGTERGSQVAGLAYRWIEQQPSYETWASRHARNTYVSHGLSLAGTNVFVQLLCWWSVLDPGPNPNYNYLAGNFVFSPILTLVLGILVMLAAAPTAKREDDAPVAIPVCRTAFVEEVGGAFVFGVLEELPGEPARLAVSVPWNDLGQFSRVDYLGAFHSGQQMNFPVSYWAVVTPVSAGGYALASITIEGENTVLERVTQLNRIFGMEARSKFYQKRSIIGTLAPLTKERETVRPTAASGEVPDTFD